MNPAVERLLSLVTNPVLRTSLLHALRQPEPIQIEHTPADLLPVLLIIATVGREYSERRVDDFPLLRKRLEEESDYSEDVVRQLMAGASLRSTTPNYPPSASANCGPGEIQLHYLPIGARFQSVSSYGTKIGTLVDKTHCRATVIWENGPKATTIHSNRTGATVTFMTESTQRTGCALEAPVVPIHTSLNTEDVDWITNAYKELTGVFEPPRKVKR